MIIKNLNRHLKTVHGISQKHHAQLPAPHNKLPGSRKDGRGMEHCRVEGCSKILTAQNFLRHLRKCHNIADRLQYSEHLRRYSYFNQEISPVIAYFSLILIQTYKNPITMITKQQLAICKTHIFKLKKVKTLYNAPNFR